MNTTEFLNTVLADTGSYVAYTSQGGGVHKQIKQTYHDTIDELVQRGEQASNTRWDAYFALATFSKKGTRKAEYATHFRALFVDVDCGPEKPYPTQADGLQALITFCRKFTLPRPIIVSSGRGLHVYWPLEATVTKEAWQRVAWRLSTVAAKENFHVDTSITSNPSAVLRMPYTLHYKAAPKLVEILSSNYIAKPLSFYVATLGEETRQRHFTPHEMDPVTKSILSNYTSSFKTILHKTHNGTGCAQLLDLITTQATATEPQWRAALSIAAYTVEAEKAIHMVSKDHPQYSYEETELKAAGIKGPFKCETFEKINPGKCSGCKHQGVIASPIVLGRMVAEASEKDNIVISRPTDLPEEFAQTYVIPRYPTPYFRGAHGGVFKREKKRSDTGEEVETERPVYHNDLYMVKRLMDVQNGECFVMRLHLPKDGVREFTIANTEVTSAEALRKKFAAQGVAVGNIEQIKMYVISWVNYLQAMEKAAMTHMQFGWVKKGEERTSFVAGNKEFFPDTIMHSPPSSATSQYMSYFTKAGTLEGWKETMRFFTKRPNTEMHKFIVGCGFGAQFMDFSAVRGLGIHTYSAVSGYGKTTAMLAAAAIWGDPSRLMMKREDTHASRFARMEVFKNICMFFDEVTNINAEEASTYAYAIPHGLQRSRLESDSNKERWQGMPWSTLAVSTGNIRLTDKIRMSRVTPDAEMRRILEIEATKSAQLVKEDSDELAYALTTNYGHAYLPFMQYVMKNLKEVEDLWNATRRRLDAEAKLNFEDRFYSAGGASALTGLLIAKRIELIDWDIAAIFSWLVKAIRAAIAIIEGAVIDPLEVIGEYWAENYANTLSILNTEKSAEEVMLEQIVMPDSTPRGALLLRYEYDTKILYVAVAPFREWCSKRHISYDNLVKALAKGPMQAQVLTKRMAAGTRLNVPSTRALMLQNMNAPRNEPVH